MANVKDEVEELEELLVGLETEGPPIEAYSEDDDAVTLSMAAPIGDQEWMVQLSPTNRKMMSTDRVVSELGLGTLSDTTLVWRGGMEEWMPIAEVEDLTRARSSVPPPKPVLEPAALPALAPPPTLARTAKAAPVEEANGAEDGALDDADADGPTPLVPPAPAEAVSDAETPAPPTRPRSYTGRPVAVDFSSVPPKRSASLRVVLGASAAAAVMVVATLYSLSRGGVFETKAPTSEGRSVSSLAPAPGATAAAAPIVSAAAAPAAAQEPTGGSPQPAAETPPGAALSPAPAAPEGTNAEPSTSQVASSGAPEADESNPMARASKTRMKPKKRARTATSEPVAAATSEPAAAATLEAEQAPAKRAKPAPRSKPQSVAAKPAGEEPSEDAEEAAAPAPGPTVGFNRQAAKDALKDAAVQAANCRPAGGPTGSGKVQIRYDATGKVGSVSILTPGFENTTTGSCIQMVFRRAKVASFSGAPVVMTESFEIK